jgi:hypothetical protein
MSLSELGPDSAWRVIHLANDCLEMFDAGAWDEALDIWINCDLDADERVQAWTFFDSKQRAWLKQDARKYIDEYLES